MFMFKYIWYFKACWKL